MAHPVNLLDAGFVRRREITGSIALAASAAGVLLLLGAVAAGLNTLSRQAAERARSFEQTTQALAAQPLGAQRDAGDASRFADAQRAEQQRLQAADAAQDQLRHAIDAGLAGPQQRYSEYLLALSRQTRSGLWLTGFSVAADGRSLDLSGRMTDPAQLTDYLRRLNEEPLFKGREFAELSLKSAPRQSGGTAGNGDDGSTGNTGNAEMAEFALRSQPRAAKELP